MGVGAKLPPTQKEQQGAAFCTGGKDKQKVRASLLKLLGTPSLLPSLPHPTSGLPLQGGTRAHTQKGSSLGSVLCCHLEILNNFFTKRPYFPLVWLHEVFKSSIHDRNLTLWQGRRVLGQALPWLGAGWSMHRSCAQPPSCQCPPTPSRSPDAGERAVPSLEPRRRDLPPPHHRSHRDRGPITTPSALEKGNRLHP